MSTSALRWRVPRHRAALALLAFMLAAGCTSDVESEQKAGVSAATVDAGAAEDPRALPCEPVSGSLARIYDPSAAELWPVYINDHTFVRGPDDQWHLFGITGVEPGALVPKAEHDFAHASSASLTSPMWTKLANALSVDPTLGETVLWAPHVIEHESRYWMFYCGGGSDDASYQMRLATSSDLVTWVRHPSPLFADGFEARDPFVLRVGAQWVMYYTATDDPDGGHFSVAYRTSTDLLSWSPRAIAYTDATTGTGAGPTESPFVIARDEGYYLFIGSSEDYLATRVFHSLDALHFSGPAITQLDVHAPEIVKDLDGKEYISHAGWGQGGVFLAPLTWRCAGE